MSIKLTHLILVMLLAYMGNAQDVKLSNLSWTVTGLSDLDNGVTSNTYTCTFKSMGSQRIVWEQKKGYTVTFLVTSIVGSWADITKAGQVTYNVTTDGETGTLNFQKTSAGTIVILDLSQKAGNRLRLKYSVIQVNAINQ